jgi:excinuclease ABC subunit A
MRLPASGVHQTNQAGCGKFWIFCMPPLKPGLSAVEAILVHKARQHNLKDVSLALPKGQLIVFTGPSGSGKSSLAFDTLYAEGQRRYVESLSAYARQFLELMPKPDVDRIEGMAPAISIEQKTIANNPRSTVGTVTEIYDYLRLLFARVGTAYSPLTGQPIQAQTRPMMAAKVAELPLGTRFYVMAPIARAEKGEFRKELRDLRARGYQRVHIDGQVHDLDEPIDLDRNKRHTISVVVDRLVNEPGDEADGRLLASLELALALGKGIVVIQPMQAQPSLPGKKSNKQTGLPADDQSAQDQQLPQALTLSAHFACPVSGFTVEEIEPRLFSFNNPFGACKSCGGIGIVSWGVGLHEEDGVDLDRLPACEACHGYRLKPQALCVKIGQVHIGQVCAMPIDEMAQWCQSVPGILSAQTRPIAERILREISSRLEFLLEVGLNYLTLDRRSGTLSGGESQRIRLASQVGSGLTGVLYVLDEPSIGLHQRDNDRLLATLKKLKNLGNTVIVVEHDEDAIRTADTVVDFGPGAGRFGGEICAMGNLATILAAKNSLTGAYLSGRLKIDVPSQRRPGSGQAIKVMGARAHNLQNVDVDFPLGKMVCITGVSGSGKSSLVMDTLCPGVHAALNGLGFPETLEGLQGHESIDKMVPIDQSPIGRTPRSNPATYTGVFTPIREWFAGLPEAKARGYAIGRFSFNVKGGRCEACGGDGVITVAMHFLPDMHVPCEACKGRRYGPDTLSITYNGKSIADVLEMSIDEACDFFKAIPTIAHRLGVLASVGLGYLQLGQSATTLSGGEAQRVKLAKELSRRSTGKTLYVMDEPTTGLHFQDVKVLLQVINRLVDQGNTVLIIEHNLEVIKTADWVIDVGPEGGRGGGTIVAQGTPEDIARSPHSQTGRYLGPMLN